MANVDHPSGFQPVMRTLSGGQIQLFTHPKDADETTPIRPFDIVRLEADANINPGGTPGTTRFLGVAMNYGAGSKVTRHGVIEAPDAVYVAQDDGSNSGILAVDIGLNANAVFNAGSERLSGHEINSNTKQTTNTLDLKLLRLHASAENDYGTFARIEVVINKHIRREGAGI